MMTFHNTTKKCLLLIMHGALFLIHRMISVTFTYMELTYEEDEIMTKQKRALQDTDLCNIVIGSDPQFTPDGTAFSYITTRVNEENNYESRIHVHDMESNETSEWTTGEERLSHQRYSPDGKHLTFLSNRSGKNQLWILSTSGGEGRQLTTCPNGVSNPIWADDETVFFQTTLEDGEKMKEFKELSTDEQKKKDEKKKKDPIVITTLKHKSDAGGMHENTYTHIVSYHIPSETYTQHTSGKIDYQLQDISSDQQTVLYTANKEDDVDTSLKTDMYTLDVRSQVSTKLSNKQAAFGHARFSPNNEKVACLGHDYSYDGATLNELLVIDIATKECVSLTESLDIQLGDAMIGDMRLGVAETGPYWDNDGNSLFVIGTDRGATQLYHIDLTGAVSIIYDQNNHLFTFTHHRGTDQWVIGVSTPTNPGEFYLLEDIQQATPLTTMQKQFIQKVELQEPEEITITADDGWEIQGWLLRPYGFDPVKKYPFILEVHGGPHAMYGNTFFHELQLLAAEGYVVLYTNPRGGYGYGQQFVDAVRGDYGGKDYTDLMTAVNTALEKFDFIDQDRLGVTGGSYGGFMTNWIVGHTDRFKAAVTQRSISNWLSFYGVSDIGFFFTKWELGHNLLEDPTALWKFSPLKYANDVKTPLLILHGEQDLRCPIEQGEQLFTTLKHAGKETEFVRFPGANHELSRSGDPTLRLERLRHIVRWFETYM